MDILNTYSDGPCEAKQVESPSILDTMLRKKIRLSQQLADVNNCIDALKANPEVNNILELIAKAR